MADSDARTSARADLLRRLGENVAEDADHLVELLLARDERRRDLDHRVAAVVGAADETALEQRSREKAAQEPLALVLGERLARLFVLDVRGTGFFYALELVKDKETRETFTDDECEWLLRGFLSGALFERGLICRADDRGDPVIQVSPPLVAGPCEFDEIVGILGDVLTDAAKLVAR